MSLRRSARLRARAFPLTELPEQALRHVASFLGPTDTMSLSGSSRGLRSSLADRRAHAQEPWTAIRPVVQEIERAAKLAGDLSRRRPATRQEAMAMATARGLTFDRAGWAQFSERGSFEVNIRRTVTARDGARLAFDDTVKYEFGDGRVRIFGSIRYEEPDVHYTISWDNVWDEDRIIVRDLALELIPEIANALVTNVLRALRTSSFEVVFEA